MQNKTKLNLKAAYHLFGLSSIAGLTLIWAYIFYLYQIGDGSLLIYEYNLAIRYIEIGIIGFTIIYVATLFYNYLKTTSTEIVKEANIKK